MHMRSCLQVMGFSSRKEADDFLQSRQKYVLGAVHFLDSPSKQLQYIIQSNTSVSFPGAQSCSQHTSNSPGALPGWCPQQELLAATGILHE